MSTDGSRTSRRRSRPPSLLPALGGLVVACWLTLLAGCQSGSGGTGFVSLPNPFKSTGNSVAKSRVWRTGRLPATPKQEPAALSPQEIARARAPAAAGTYAEARTAFYDPPASVSHAYPYTHPYPETQAWPGP